MSRSSFVGTPEREAYRARRARAQRDDARTQPARPRHRDQLPRTLHPVYVTKRRFARGADGVWSFTTTTEYLGRH